MQPYNPREIEKKWQKIWEEKRIYQAFDPPSPDGFGGAGPLAKPADRPKFYCLVEFPYPSGERLHVGHARSYCALDALARYKRMRGYNVLFPMGWDAFGLPAENYAIKTGIHPSLTTKENIEKAKAQVKSWGLSFDWQREINTTDPHYYRWTQWIFLKLLEKGLAYRAEIPVNWCPSCKINLANEEVVDGDCERCGTPTERREQKQWLLAITKYADRLLEGLENLDFEPKIKRQQVEWIGKKEGINITFKIKGSQETVTCFTTTPVNFGATFIVVAPEHELVNKILSGQIVVFSNIVKEVSRYLTTSRLKSELERIAEGKVKTGVFTGLFALNQLNGQELPIWVSDFVLLTVGTGAVQGCPGHDRRDFEFAQKFGLPIVRVVTGPNGETGAIEKPEQVVEAGSGGRMVNSEFLNGLEFSQAMVKTMDYFEEKGWGKRTVSYHLRDWVFSRQHYWGEPIPVVYCVNCANQPSSTPGVDGLDSRSLPGLVNQVSIENGVEYAIVPVPESQLPVELPFVENYKPTDDGQSPLAAIKDWINVACPECGGPARRETDTMPNWAGSSWYFLRYIDPDNDQQLASLEKLSYWLPVDWYNGGMEHTNLHLLYSRFWHKFLYDLGVVPTSEPYAKRTSHGVVLGPDGAKMSKSKGNVINPDEIVEKFGADTLRIYEMFIGPFGDQVIWNMNGVAGVYRFLGKVWNCFQTSQVRPKEGPAVGHLESGSDDRGLELLLAKLGAKLSTDLEGKKFNTAVAALMEFTNQVSRSNRLMADDNWGVFSCLLAPFAPHLAEEIWQEVSERTNRSDFASVHQQKWPESTNLIDSEVESEVEIVVQVNGRLRDRFKLPLKDSKVEEVVVTAAVRKEKVSKYVANRAYRVVFVPRKLVNFVVS